MTRGAPAARATVIEALHTLLKADLADKTPLRYESIRAIHWKVARLASAVTANTGEVPLNPASAKCVDMHAVERFRAEIGRFAAADNGIGGGRDRKALIGHLVANVKRLARGARSEQIDRALCSAIAEGILLLAWMTFDVAPESALTQKYFTYARLLAHRADNRLLEPAVLAAMINRPVTSELPTKPWNLPLPHGREPWTVTHRASDSSGSRSRCRSRCRCRCHGSRYSRQCAAIRLDATRLRRPPGNPGKSPGVSLARGNGCLGAPWVCRFSSCPFRVCRGAAGGRFRVLPVLVRCSGVGLTAVIAGHPGAWPRRAGRFARCAPVCGCRGPTVSVIAGHRGRISPILTRNREIVPSWSPVCSVLCR